MSKFYLQKIGKSYYKCWYIRVTPHGIKPPKGEKIEYICKKETLGKISKELAVSIINTLNEDKLRTKYGLDPRDKLFIQFLDEYLKYHTRKSPETQKRNNITINNFIRLIPIEYVSEFNLNIIDKYIYERKKENPKLKNSTLNREINTLTSMSRKMKQWNYTKTNLLADIERPDNEDVAPKYFSSDQLSLIFQNFTSGWLTAALIGYYLAARLDEAVSLQETDIDWENHSIRILASKTGKLRVLPLCDPLYYYLSDLKNKGIFASNKLLVQFPKASIKSISSMSHIFIKKLHTLGIEGKSFRTLRHTFATNLRSYNENQANVKDLLGHSSFAMTERYSHLVAPQALYQAVSKLPNYIKKEDNK